MTPDDLKTIEAAAAMAKGVADDLLNAQPKYAGTICWPFNNVEQRYNQARALAVKLDELQLRLKTA